MQRFISFSGGVESTTMCLLYGKGAKAIWCDTGWEHPEMYQRLEMLESFFKDYHGGEFELIRVKPSVTAKGRKVDSLPDYISAMAFMPSGRARYCTDRFKIQPIENFLESAGECELLIGFNADEEPGKERKGNLGLLPNVTYRYPLFEDGYTREDCETMLDAFGLKPDFPPYMQRGGCVGCIFKSVGEFKALYYFDRATFDSVRALEESIQDKRGKFFAISMTQNPMSRIADLCETEISMFGEDGVKSMYQKIKPSQSCGAFCHR